MKAAASEVLAELNRSPVVCQKLWTEYEDSYSNNSISMRIGGAVGGIRRLCSLIGQTDEATVLQVCTSIITLTFMTCDISGVSLFIWIGSH